MNFILRPGKPNIQSFEGKYTKDRITMTGYGGQLLFTGCWKFEKEMKNNDNENY